MESGQVDGRGLLVTGGDAAPSLQGVDAPLNGVGLLAGLAVEGRWVRRPGFLAAVGDVAGRPGQGSPSRSRLRKWLRIAREEYVSSARTMSDLVRGRPRRRGTRRRAINSMKAGASPACPAVRWKTSGRQRLSAARWIFVVSPPRDRPTAWSSGSPVLVRVGLGHQGSELPLPGAIDGPHPRPVADTSRVAILPSRHMKPLGTRLKLEGDRVDHLTMVPPGATPLRRPVREQRLNPRPLRISQRPTRTDDQLIQTTDPR